MKPNRAGRVCVVALVIVSVGLFLAAGCSDAFESPVVSQNETTVIQSEMAKALANYQQGVQERLMVLEADASSCSEAIADVGVNDPELSDLLGDCVAKNSWYNTIAFIDPDGVVQAVVPETEQGILGVDLSYQESVAVMNRDPSFMMVPVFTLEQGGSAAAAYEPVISEDGEYLGFVSITFEPAALIRPVAENVSGVSGFDTMAAQTDSLVLYDADVTEIGQMTFGNPLYKDFQDLLAFAEAYNQSSSGVFCYSFHSSGFGEVITKEVMWDSVTCGGMAWRLMVIRPV